jgi:uncharacterized protein YpbB
MIEEEISDLEESLSGKEQSIKTYKDEIDDWELLDKELSSVIEQMSTKKVKQDVKTFIKLTNEKKILEAKKKINEEETRLEETTNLLRQLERQVHYLNVALCNYLFRKTTLPDFLASSAFKTVLWLIAESAKVAHETEGSLPFR